MEKKYNFDYYYGTESEQFSFFRVPKILFTDSKFKGISTDAKILYGMMLDRMSLSRQNKWIDDENRVYIIYTLNEIMEDLCCGKDKGVHLISELDERGIGLIERRKQGFGKPALIYVKNFIVDLEEEIPERDERELEREPRESRDEFYAADEQAEDDFSGNSGEESLESLENYGFRQTSEKPKSLGAICRSRDFGKTEAMTSEKPKSRGRENRSLEVGKTEVNNTNNNKTYNNKNNYNNTNPLSSQEVISGQKEEMRANNAGGSLPEIIKQNIELDRCMEEMDTDAGKRKVRFLYDLICDVVCHPRQQIRIGGIAMPYLDVRDIFLELTAEPVLHVARRMLVLATSSRLNNPSSYAITALYNAMFNMAEDELPEVEHFEEFWEAYPLKIRKTETEREYMNLVAANVEEKELVDAAKNYAEETSILQSEKVCYPTNFLTREVYKDYVPGRYVPPKISKRQRMNGLERDYTKGEIDAIEQAMMNPI